MSLTNNNHNKTQENKNSNIECYVQEVFKSAGRMPKIEQALDLAFFVKHIINIDANNLQYASDRLKNNKEVVLNALTKDGMALRFASEKLKDNKNIVLFAIENNESERPSCPQAFQYASQRLKNDRAFITQVLEKDNNILDYVSTNIQKSLLESPYNKKAIFPQMIKLISIADKFKDLITITPAKMKSKKLR